MFAIAFASASVGLVLVTTTQGGASAAAMAWAIALMGLAVAKSAIESMRWKNQVGRMSQQVRECDVAVQAHKDTIATLTGELNAALRECDKQRELKHDAISELNSLSLCIQMYRTTHGRMPDDPIDLDKIFDWNRRRESDLKP